MTNNSHQWIALPQNGSYVLVESKDILYCASDGNYSTIFLQDGNKYVACRKLKEMEALLPEESFVRIHHTFIVSLFHVKKYHKGDGGQVELSNGLKLGVSRRKKQDFLNRLIVI